MKCEKSEARSAEEAAVTYLLQQGFRDPNIAYESVNTRQRTEPSNQEHRIKTPLCYGLSHCVLKKHYMVDKENTASCQYR